MNPAILHRTIRQFRQLFLADFNKLTEQDVCTILNGPSETLLTILSKHYGYSSAQAIAAWNDFVLRRVNGPHTKVSGSAFARAVAT